MNSPIRHLVVFILFLLPLLLLPLLISNKILLTFSCYFDNPQMPCAGAFEQKLSAQFKCPAYARPPPQQLNIDRCNMPLFGLVQIINSNVFTHHPACQPSWRRIAPATIWAAVINTKWKQQDDGSVNSNKTNNEGIISFFPFSRVVY